MVPIEVVICLIILGTVKEILYKLNNRYDKGYMDAINNVIKAWNAGHGLEYDVKLKLIMLELKKQLKGEQ